MTRLFDVDLIPRILSVDRKVRPSGTNKRRERGGEDALEDRPKRLTVRESNDGESEREGAVDITV